MEHRTEEGDSLLKLHKDNVKLLSLKQTGEYTVQSLLQPATDYCNGWKSRNSRKNQSSLLSHSDRHCHRNCNDIIHLAIWRGVESVVRTKGTTIHNTFSYLRSDTRQIVAIISRRDASCLSVQYLDRSLLLLVTLASDLPLRIAVRLSSRNVDASCNKHFVVVFREQQTTPLSGLVLR